MFEVGLSQGGEYHFKCFPKALGCDTIQVPNPGFPHECEHTFTSFLISRVGSTADFLFVSGLLPPDHVYSILRLRVNVNRLFLINRKFFCFYLTRTPAAPPVEAHEPVASEAAQAVQHPGGGGGGGRGGGPQARWASKLLAKLKKSKLRIDVTRKMVYNRLIRRRDYEKRYWVHPCFDRWPGWRR